MPTGEREKLKLGKIVSLHILVVGYVDMTYACTYKRLVDVSKKKKQVSGRIVHQNLLLVWLLLFCG